MAFCLKDCRRCHVGPVWNAFGLYVRLLKDQTSITRCVLTLMRREKLRGGLRAKDDFQAERGWKVVFLFCTRTRP